MANYERIKQMSVEEMTLFLGRKPYCYLENGDVDCIYGWHGCQCEEHAKKWLMKQLGIDKEEWDKRVEGFKAQGCTLF